MTKTRVTDHAIMRYVERVLGISRDELERKIIPEGMELRDGTHAAGTHRICVKNGMVVTIMELTDYKPVVDRYERTNGRKERAKSERKMARNSK